MGGGPWASLPEQIVTDRLEAFMNANAEAMESVRPPIPNIGKVMPRFGYPTQEIGIYDVVNVDERYPGPKSDALSQRPGYTGTSLPGWSNG